MADLKAFDVHQHFGAIDLGVGSRGGWDVEVDYQQRVAMMDRFGVGRGAIMPSLQYERPNGQADTQRVNNLMAQYKKNHPDRFPVAFGVVEPLHGEKLGLLELDRIGGELKLDGVVWHHHFQGTFIADRRMFAFLKKMGEFGLIAAIHVISESLLEAHWGLEVLAREFPNITFICIDAFTGVAQIWNIRSMFERCPNVYLETGGTFTVGRRIDKMVEQFGSERILYGSDLYLPPPAFNFPQTLAEIRESGFITDTDKQNILWNNPHRLFKLKTA